MRLLWIFRGIFIIVVLAVLFVNASSEVFALAENSPSLWAVILSGAGMAVFVLLMDILTPKKKLSALSAS
jgi:hypothetical protein